MGRLGGRERVAFASEGRLWGPLSPQGAQSLVLLRPSTDWARPTHTQTVCVSQSPGRRAGLIQKHPERPEESGRVSAAWPRQSTWKTSHRVRDVAHRPLAPRWARRASVDMNFNPSSAQERAAPHPPTPLLGLDPPTGVKSASRRDTDPTSMQHPRNCHRRERQGPPAVRRRRTRTRSAVWRARGRGMPVGRGDNAAWHHPRGELNEQKSQTP